MTTRHLTVSTVLENANYWHEGENYKPKPAIRLAGRWLERAGFRPGDKVKVHVEDGRLEVKHTTEEARP